MKRLVPLLLAAAGAAGAAGGWESPERITRVVSDYVRTQAPAHAAVELQVALDPSLRLPECASVPSAFGMGSSGRNSFSIGVSCPGPSAWKLYVPVRLIAFAEVVVVARSLPRGEPLAADSVRSERRDLGTLALGYFTDPARVAGMRLRRPLAPGTVLTPADVESPSVVHRGQLVTLLGRSGALEIRAQGKALADGGLQDRIRVQNLGSKRVIEGVVRSADIVEVAF